MNKVIARFADGRMIRGVTADFSPMKDLFHLSDANAPAGTKSIVIKTNELKALFFVKDFAGNPQHKKSNEFDYAHPQIGRKIKVIFHDGEVLVGTTTGYQPERPGFFLVPADAGANNERCYIVAAATKEVSFV
jgi:hypothetical protein